MNESEFEQALRAGDPPVRDPAFTMRVLEAAAAARTRRDLRLRWLGVGMLALAAFGAAPAALDVLPQSGETLALAAVCAMAAITLARAMGQTVRPS